MYSRFLLLMLLPLIFGGCTLMPSERLPMAACEHQLMALHDAAVQQGIADVQARPVGEYPYLRADRLMWSLLPEVETEERRRAWLQLALEQGKAALAADHANLADGRDLQRLYGCLESGVSELVGREDYLRELGTRPYPGEYQTAYRLLGLYPISRQLMLSGLAGLHAELEERFRQGPSHPQRSYVFQAPNLLEPSEIATWLREAVRRNPLGLPRLDDLQRDRLLAHFAPVWEIETLGDHDLPGIPVRRAEQVAVETRQPVTFSHVSYTRWSGQMLLQLNYLLWFDERPAVAPLDIYSGRLDGLILRLTLDQHGRPMVVDSIHPCGCYHVVVLFDRKLHPRGDGELGEPPLWLPAPARGRAPGERLHVAISSGDHMLIGLRWGVPPAEAKTYALRPLDSLRHRAPGELSRSLYSTPYGLIDGSERLEGLLLWPSGIVSPGAMRQWGRHAIAFGARRHFDDAALFEQLLTSQ